MARIDELLKEVKEMSEEELHQIAKYHLARYRKQLERKRAEKGL